jgi:hypothetical protein
MLRILPREVGPDGNDWNNPGVLCFCEACPEDLARPLRGLACCENIMRMGHYLESGTAL